MGAWDSGRECHGLGKVDTLSQYRMLLFGATASSPSSCSRLPPPMQIDLGPSCVIRNGYLPLPPGPVLTLIRLILDQNRDSPSGDTSATLHTLSTLQLNRIEPQKPYFYNHNLSIRNIFPLCRTTASSCNPCVHSIHPCSDEDFAWGWVRRCAGT